MSEKISRSVLLPRAGAQVVKERPAQRWRFQVRAAASPRRGEQRCRQVGQQSAVSEFGAQAGQRLAVGAQGVGVHVLAVQERDGGVGHR
ncbi:hypothetical protein AB0K16_20570 [Nonomuraea jabiensis]|uniref:hypothetical protein n=1 Tax=Nonomuraea jabiensis TaxID=882448 RepID=UPI00343F4327